VGDGALRYFHASGCPDGRLFIALLILTVPLDPKQRFEMKWILAVVLIGWWGDFYHLRAVRGNSPQDHQRWWDARPAQGLTERWSA